MHRVKVYIELRGMSSWVWISPPRRLPGGAAIDTPEDLVIKFTSSERVKQRAVPRGPGAFGVRGAGRVNPYIPILIMMALAVFIVILLVGYIYIWKRGAFEWD